MYIHSWVYRIPEKLGKKTVMEPWPLPRASVCPMLGWDLTAFSLSITLEMSISITHWPREYGCFWARSLLSVWAVTCSGLSGALRAHNALLWLGTMLQYLFLPHGDLTLQLSAGSTDCLLHIAFGRANGLPFSLLGDVLLLSMSMK